MDMDSRQMVTRGKWGKGEVLLTLTMNPNRSCTSGVYHVASAPAWPSGNCSFHRNCYSGQLGIPLPEELQIPGSILLSAPPAGCECKLPAPGRAAARGPAG